MAVLTLGLQNLRRQVDAAFPDRGHASDGTMGDAAHQAETSGHNPDDTPGARPEWNGDADQLAEIRAWDMDADLGIGVNTQALIDHLRALPDLDTVLRYMIYNRRIYRASTGWAPEQYTGASAHTEHVHFSGAYTQAADNNQTFDFHLEEIPVAFTPADKTWLSGEMRKQAIAAVTDQLDEIAAAVLENKRFPWSVTPGSTYQRNAADLLGDPWFIAMTGKTRGGDPAPAAGVPGQLLARMADLAAKLDKLAAAKPTT